MEEFAQQLLQLIKDYGAPILGTVSVSGIAAVGAIIAKIKKAFDDTKTKFNDIINKKEEEAQNTKAEYSALIDQMHNQNAKIDKLTSAIEKVENNGKI